MSFQLRRYYFGLIKYKFWLLIFLVPPVTFLTVTALVPSQFLINQTINISNDTPVAIMTSPIGTRPVQEFITHPEKLFLNPFALKALYTDLHHGTGDWRSDPQFRMLAATVQQHMMLRQSDGHTIQVNYSGPDRQLGNTMVGFYSERLVRNALEGIQRSRTVPEPAQIPKITSAATISAQNRFLPPMYFLSFLQTVLASLLGALILAAILEFRDPSFKSERQMAEYLELPILGSFPNLNRVYSAMEK
jgi:hypothetical protein